MADRHIASVTATLDSADLGSNGLVRITLKEPLREGDNYPRAHTFQVPADELAELALGSKHEIRIVQVVE